MNCRFCEGPYILGKLRETGTLWVCPLTPAHVRWFVRQGDFDGARKCLQVNCQRAKQQANIHAEGLALAGLGAVALCRKNTHHALKCFEGAYSCFILAGDTYSEAVALLGKALTHQATGQWTEMDECFHRAFQILQREEDPAARAFQQEIQERDAAAHRLYPLEGAALPARELPDKAEKPPTPPRPILRLVPIVGRVPASSLREAIRVNLGYVFVNDVLIEGRRYVLESLESKMGSEVRWRTGSTYFTLQAQGHSMVDANVSDGDYVLFESREEAADKDIVTVLVDGQTTLKRFFQKPDHTFLQPENPDESPIVVIESDDLEDALRQRYRDHQPPVDIKVATDAKVMGKALMVFKPIST